MTCNIISTKTIQNNTQNDTQNDCPCDDHNNQKSIFDATPNVTRTTVTTTSSSPILNFDEILDNQARQEETISASTLMQYISSEGSKKQRSTRHYKKSMQPDADALKRYQFEEHNYTKRTTLFQGIPLAELRYKLLTNAFTRTNWLFRETVWRAQVKNHNPSKQMNTSKP